MSEKKELNVEELEEVTGGGMYKYKHQIVWLFTKDAPIQMILLDQTTAAAKVTKRGCDHIGNSYFDYYYVECISKPSVNGWYSASDFKGNVVHAYDRDPQGNMEIINW